VHSRSTQPTRWRIAPTLLTVIVALVLGAATARADVAAPPASHGAGVGAVAGR
jgi:hypothetical protein